MYDITRRETFTHVRKWLQEVRVNSSKNITMILIGNKKDLEDRREVRFEEGESFARENGIMFLETSAKTAFKVVEAFTLSAQAILNNIEITGSDPTENKNKMKIENIKTEEENKEGCC